jgi:GNAT superfamily N-acetyltransferase
MKLAKQEDLERVMALYRDCTEKMNANGLFNWDKTYPDTETILQNIKDQSLYLFTNEGLEGVVCLDENQPSAYDEKDWELPDSFVCVHRLAISPGHQGKGLSKRMMNRIEVWARGRGYGHIRLDAFSENKIARNLYTKLGYTEKGLVHLYPEKENTYMCFEKLL